MQPSPRSSLFVYLAVALVGVILGAAWFQTHPPDSELGTEQSMPKKLANRLFNKSQLPPLANAVWATDPDGLSKLTANLKTNHGNIRFKFYPKDAPQTTRRIAELIQSRFYDGQIFFRVVPQFTIQTGDPEGMGTGGSGQTLPAEVNPRKHTEGAVGLAHNSDPNSGDSQFYITLAPQPQLDGNYTVFAQVIEGLDVAKKIQRGDRIVQLNLEP